MSAGLNGLKKRRCYKVTINGEDQYVRNPTHGDNARAVAVANVAVEGEDAEVTQASRSVWLLYAFAMCDATGELLIPKSEGETDAAWADRIEDELRDVPPENLREVRQAVARTNKTPDAEAALKN